MSVWKQLLLSLVLLVVAAGSWIYFVPSARTTLAGMGIDLPAFASAPPAADAATSEAASRPQRQGGAEAGMGVVTGAVSSATINDQLAAIGTGRANSTVSVRPFSTGRLTEVTVESGDRVEAGQVLARLDAETETIAVDRARIALDDARQRLDRVVALRNSNTASAVQLTEAELAVRNAELELRDAELALERRTIEAPITGVVGLLPITAGNYVTTESEVATIDDRSRILVDFWVPERFASQIEVGMPLTASSIARPGENFTGTVSAVDNSVDPDSRTLRVRAEVTNPGDRLRAGMSFQVSLRFEGDTYPSVAPLAVQWGTEGAFVWVVRDGTAVRTPVEIVQRNTESILVNAEFSPDDQVVVEGLHLVREGAPVMIARRDSGASAPAATASTASGS